MIVNTIICHVLSHYKNKYNIRLLHRLIKQQTILDLHTSMTSNVARRFIHPTKKLPGDIILILAMLVAFASRTRGRDFERPASLRITKRTSVRMSFLLCERETGIEPAAPTLARWCSTAEPLAHVMCFATKHILHYGLHFCQ